MCLADDSSKNAMKVYDDYMTPDAKDGFYFFLAMYNFMFSFNRYCGVQDVVYDAINWIADANFTPQDLGKNFMLKLFTVTGALNNIGMIFYTTTLPPISDSGSYFTIY